MIIEKAVRVGEYCDTVYLGEAGESIVLSLDYCQHYSDFHVTVNKLYNVNCLCEDGYIRKFNMIFIWREKEEYESDYEAEMDEENGTGIFYVALTDGDHPSEEEFILKEKGELEEEDDILIEDVFYQLLLAEKGEITNEVIEKVAHKIELYGIDYTEVPIYMERENKEEG